MALARVGSVSSGTAGTVTFPQTPTSGNLILITAVATRSLTATPATTCSNGAYGTIDSGDITIGTNHARVTQFWKIASSSEAAPTLTATNLTCWQVEEFSGVLGHNTDSAGVGSSATTQTTSTTPNVTPTAEITTLAKNNTEAVTWSNGAVADSGPNSGGSSWAISSATKNVTGTSASSNTATWTSAVQSVMLTSGWTLKPTGHAGPGIGGGGGVMSA